MIDGKVVESFDLRPRLFKPDKIAPEAMEKTGMTKKGIMARPMGPKDAWEMFVEIIGKYVNPYDKRDKLVFVAYNAKFDFDFLRRMAEKCGEQFFGSWFWWPPICVAVLAMDRISVANRAKLPDFKLGTLVSALGIDVDPDKLHDACYDIYLTRLLHEMVGNRVPKAVDERP